MNTRLAYPVSIGLGDVGGAASCGVCGRSGDCGSAAAQASPGDARVAILPLPLGDDDMCAMVVWMLGPLRSRGGRMPLATLAVTFGRGTRCRRQLVLIEAATAAATKPVDQ